MKFLRVELFIDILWVAGAAAYIIAASQYPSSGRLVPTIVGMGALICGLIQLSGNLFPKLRLFTHGEDPNEALEAEEPWLGWPSLLKAIGWSVFLLALVFIIGAIWAMPVFFILYFGLRGGRWWIGVVSGLVMMGVTWGVFEQLMQLQLPTGIIPGLGGG